MILYDQQAAKPPPRSGSKSQPSKRVTEPFAHTSAMPQSASQPALSDNHWAAAEARGAEAREHAHEGRERYDELNTFLTMVRGICPVEFARDGRRVNRHTPLFTGCGVYDIDRNWLSFKKSFHFEPFKFCYRCGVPLGHMEPPCHKSVAKLHGMRCPWDDFIFVVVYCLWRIPSSQLDIAAEFGLSPLMDTEDFEIWTQQEEPNTGKLYNLLEVFLWYCRSKCKGKGRA